MRQRLVWLTLPAAVAMLVIATCKGSSQCEGDACIGEPCSASMPCPAGLFCDPVSMTCVRQGSGIDAAPTADATPQVGSLTLTVLNAAGPLELADVVVSNADGSV